MAAGCRGWTETTSIAHEAASSTLPITNSLASYNRSFGPSESIWTEQSPERDDEKWKGTSDFQGQLKERFTVGCAAQQAEGATPLSAGNLVLVCPEFNFFEMPVFPVRGFVSFEPFSEASFPVPAGRAGKVGARATATTTHHSAARGDTGQVEQRAKCCSTLRTLLSWW